MKTIKFENVSFSYDKQTPILDDFSLEIPFGSYVSLIGPNGAGKSTIAKLLIGLLKPQKGEIFVDDLPVNKENLNTIRQRIGTVFQNPDNQFIASTVEDDIAFGLENRRVDPNAMKEIICKCANKVGMEDYLDKEPSYLSGGQKQRVAIAGVLALNPDILVLDEATSMLDPKGRDEIASVIRQMRKDNPNLTIISITHHFTESAESDLVVIVRDGKVQYKGTPFEVYSNNEIVENYNLNRPLFYEIRNYLKDKIDVENVKDLDGMVDLLCQSK